jgi:hypothetical protein
VCSVGYCAAAAVYACYLLALVQGHASCARNSIKHSQGIQASAGHSPECVQLLLQLRQCVPLQPVYVTTAAGLTLFVKFTRLTATKRRRPWW